MKATSIGIWYQQIPNGHIVNPLGEVVVPKVHNGSVFILKDRKRVPVSKLPKLSCQEVINFKSIFWYQQSS